MGTQIVSKTTFLGRQIRFSYMYQFLHRLNPKNSLKEFLFF